jgi:hypothetical protein
MIRRAGIHNHVWRKLVIMRIGGSRRHPLGATFLGKLAAVSERINLFNTWR